MRAYRLGAGAGGMQVTFPPKPPGGAWTREHLGKCWGVCRGDLGGKGRGRLGATTRGETWKAGKDDDSGVSPQGNSREGTGRLVALLKDLERGDWEAPESHLEGLWEEGKRMVEGGRMVPGSHLERGDRGMGSHARGPGQRGQRSLPGGAGEKGPGSAGSRPGGGE